MEVLYIFSNRFTITQHSRTQIILLQATMCFVSSTWTTAICPTEISASQTKASHLICSVPCFTFYWPTSWCVLAKCASRVFAKTVRWTSRMLDDPGLLCRQTVTFTTAAVDNSVDTPWRHRVVTVSRIVSYNNYTRFKTAFIDVTMNFSTASTMPRQTM